MNNINNFSNLELKDENYSDRHFAQNTSLGQNNNLVSPRDNSVSSICNMMKQKIKQKRLGMHPQTSKNKNVAITQFSKTSTKGFMGMSSTNMFSSRRQTYDGGLSKFNANNNSKFRTDTTLSPKKNAHIKSKLSPINNRNSSVRKSLNSSDSNDDKMSYNGLNNKLQFPNNPAYSHMKNVGTADTIEA